MYHTTKHCLMTLLVVAASWLTGAQVYADVVTDWSSTAGEIAVAGKLPPGGAYRAVAAVQTAVYEAVNAITKRYTGSRVPLQASLGASVEAAVAAANRATLTALAPAQQTAIEKAYQAALAALPDGPAKTAGIAVGDEAAKAILALCAGDGFDTPESYRPSTTAGLYVPTAVPDLAQWPKRKPWLLSSADQFRPGPPPSLTSAVWARDYNEIKALGAKQSTQRTAEQTAMARFWEARVPTIYLPVVLSVATASGREPTQNARLLAVATQAMDDALIAVADAKYHYNFWRPITAIRNGDLDGNDATERDASWVPFIDTPMHPEYPCAHCIVSATVATVLQADAAGGTIPTLRGTSPTAPGMERSWTTIEAFMQEVANARIYDGVHYRTSTEVGTVMGRKIGELAATKLK
jgi:PAP2 superfamily